MFVLTLVQSHTHVDIVQSVLHMKKTLKAHLLKSHGEGTWLLCNICYKMCTDIDTLKQHMMRHEFVKPYACSKCEKRFFTAADMKTHQLIHSDVKQICCGACGKRFRCQLSVVRHLTKCRGVHAPQRQEAAIPLT